MRSFQNTKTTGLSDFLNIVITVLKTPSKKIPRRKSHWDKHNFHSNGCKSKPNEKLNQGIKDFESHKKNPMCIYAMLHSIGNYLELTRSSKWQIMRNGM